VIKAAPAVRKVHCTVRGAALNARVFLMIPADRSRVLRKVLRALRGGNAGGLFEVSGPGAVHCRKHFLQLFNGSFGRSG
jgi:hypothetical protein